MGSSRPEAWAGSLRQLLCVTRRQRARLRLTQSRRPELVVDSVTAAQVQSRPQLVSRLAHDLR